jgi:hypothetical protein
MTMLSTLLYLITFLNIVPLQHIRTLMPWEARNLFTYCTIENKLEDHLYDLFFFTSPPFHVEISQERTNEVFYKLKYHYLPLIHDCVLNKNKTVSLTNNKHELLYDKMNMKFSTYIILVLQNKTLDGKNYPLYHNFLKEENDKISNIYQKHEKWMDEVFPCFFNILEKMADYILQFTHYMQYCINTTLYIIVMIYYIISHIFT